MGLVLIGILSALAMDMVGDSIEEARFEQTRQEMRQIADALLGNTSLKQDGVRTSFGFFGDVGALPAALTALTTNPSLPEWAVSSDVRFGYGWNGPYLVTNASSGDSLSTDEWGRAYVYSPEATPATLTSLGRDGEVGGTGYDQDLEVTLDYQGQEATVTGFLSSGGSPFVGDAEIEFNYPDGNGVISQPTDTIAASDPDPGKFEFTSVPMGLRSLTIYIPSKAAATQTIGPKTFTVDQKKFLVPATLLELSP